MRVPWNIRPSWSSLIETKSGVVFAHKLSDALIDLLAGVDTAYVTIIRKDGSVLTYGPMQYSCSLCDSYDHLDEECAACSACVEWDCHAPEDRPDICEGCGAVPGENS